MLFSGPGVNPSLKGAITNVINLQAGAVYPIGPNTAGGGGWFNAKPGKYTVLQEFDPITGIWRGIGAGSTGASIEYMYSDGQNYRLANQSGCVVGARVVNAGSGY